MTVILFLAQIYLAIGMTVNLILSFNPSTQQKLNESGWMGVVRAYLTIAFIWPKLFYDAIQAKKALEEQPEPKEEDKSEEDKDQ
jgi:hypothetical protein